MDIKKIKKLSKKELLELLIEQVKENEELTKKLEEAQKEIDRKILISKRTGSLAEASLELVDIFKKADEAAEIYLKNLENIESNVENL